MDGQTEPPLTYDLGLLEKSEAKWNRSGGLRAVYGSIYKAMRDCMVEGPSLELGSGIGKINKFIPSVITSDLVQTRYVDIACSAYKICESEEEGTNQWSNILAMDVLHHLCKPMDFFWSAGASLRKGGRLILVEPAATPFGRIFYSLFHEEPIHPGKIKPPFAMRPDTTDGEFANMGMAVALFDKHLDVCLRMLDEAGLRLIELRYRDLLAYPLTGGYSNPQLVPTAVLKGLLSLEGKLPQILLKALALRLLVVLQKV